jgi:uncharacterized protein
MKGTAPTLHPGIGQGGVYKAAAKWHNKRMTCPACDSNLSPLTVGKLTVDVCKGGCGGIWFDNFELQKVDEPEEFEGEALLHIERDDHLLVDYERRRKCPKCDNIVMMRHYFSERREVQVDTCPNCGGVWLDPGELAMIRNECKERKDRKEAVNGYLNNLFRHESFRAQRRRASQ